MSPGLVGGVSVSPVTGETVKDRSEDGAAGTSVFGVNGFLVSGLTHPVRHTSNPVNAQALEHLNIENIEHAHIDDVSELHGDVITHPKSY